MAILAIMMAVAAGPGVVVAADYPTKPIRLIVPFPPAGGSDLAARIVADAMTRRLGQQMVVENRPGASGTIGTNFVARSAPDGYTLLWTSTDFMTAAAVKPSIPYVIPDDFTFISRFAQNGMVLVVNTEVPATTLKEFIDFAKAHPGAIRYGSTGIGGSPHLATLIFAKYAGISMMHVPYKGVASSLSDLLSGRIECELITPITIAPYVTSDKIRLLAITSPTRHPLLPNVPTMAEASLPQATPTVWYGLFGPAKLPAPVLDRLLRESAAVIQDPDVIGKLQAAGLQIAPLAGAAFEKAATDEYRQWKDVARAQQLMVTE